jgi:outer membrane protein OmpA-like peptidoglycan-associated protein
VNKEEGLMKRVATASALVALLALSGAAAAQDPAAGACTVKKEEVKTWIQTFEGKEFAVRPAAPSVQGDTGLFHLSSAYTLGKGKMAFGLYYDNFDRDPKDEDIAKFGLAMAYGATDKLEVFGSLDFLTRVDADAVFQQGFSNEFPFVSTGWQTGIGDLRVGAKYKFLDDYAGAGVGLAVKGLLKLPTADENKGLGTGKASYGVTAILSKSINQKADFHASFGYEINADPTNLNIGNGVKWGAGINVPACRKVQVQAEVTGTAYGTAQFKQTNPVDVVIGPAIWFKPGLFIRPAISWNVAFNDRGLGSSAKSYTGGQVAIGYHPGTRCCEVYTPPPPPPPPVNKAPTVACSVEKSQILPGETVRCRATASDPDGDPLSYEWSASTGRMSGSGAEATFDSAGVASGTSVNVKVRVSDGRGGTAESTCSVKVQAPEKKPEAQSCNSGGFPRNLTRLNNLDKACLDDVASKLRQDPRSRLIITGHADKGERYPDVLGRKRGEAVKDYLVKERGVDAARVTVRTAGANKPLDTGKTAAARAKNRRVDILFVPEGAVVPEEDD